MSVDIGRTSRQKPPMFLRLISRIILLFAAVTLVGCDQGGTVAGKVSDARARNDGPAIWVATDHDSTLYLFGTLHLLSPEVDWIKDDMRDAFKASGTIFFEVDTGPSAQIEAAVLSQSLGFYSDGRRLQDQLDSYQLKLLEAAANNGDIPVAVLDNMKPWLASEFLSIAAAATVNLSPELSADDALKSRARQQRKNVRYLDTIDGQIRRSANQADFVQMMMLSDTLEGFNGMGDDLTRTAQAWAVGNTDFLTREIVNAVRDRSPDIYQSLYDDVNEVWAKDLIRFLEGSGTGFAAVGIGHLLGDDSLQEKLRGQGYEVERHLAFMGKPVITPAAMPPTFDDED